MGAVWLAVPAVTILAVYVAASLVALTSGGELAGWLADVGFFVCAGGLVAALLVLMVERMA